MKKINILNIEIDNLTIAQANERIAEQIRMASRDKSYTVAKPYVEFFARSYRSQQYQKMLNSFDLVLADGVSAQWAASYLYGKPFRAVFKTMRSLLFWLQKKSWRTQVIEQVMAGATQTHQLFILAQKYHWKVGILGGPKDTNTMQSNVAKRYPHLHSLTCWSGYFDHSDEEKLVSDIASQNIDILFVAMGFPLQEQFITRHTTDHLAKVLIGEGGTFDFDSFGGHLRRAPRAVRTLHIEWLWRLILQPSRIARQFSIVKYVYYVKKFYKHI